MPLNLKFSVDKIKNRTVQQTVGNVNAALQILKTEIDRLTPEDTKTLLWNNTINTATVQWSTVRWSVSNDTEYAIFVEFGVKWRRYTYNKPKGQPFFVGVGNRTFTRALDNTKNRISSLIRWWV